MITYLKQNQCLVCGGGGDLDYVYVGEECLPFHPFCYKEASGETLVSEKYFTRKEWLNFAGEFYTLAKRYVVEYANGTKEWCLNELRHREDGPAIEYADGNKSWYLNGRRFSEEEYRERVKKR